MKRVHDSFGDDLLAPSPSTLGEGWGEGSSSGDLEEVPHPRLLLFEPEPHQSRRLAYREKGRHFGALVIPWLFLWLVIALPAHGQVLWTLTDSDFHNETVSLGGIDAAGIHVTRASGAGDLVVPLDRFLQLARTAPESKAGKFTVTLVGGDRLIGDPVALRQNQLVWNSSLLGEISVPLRSVAAISAAGKTSPEERRKEDVVVLANGDTVRGIVAGLADGKLSVQAEGQSTDVPLISIATVSFAATGGAPPAATGFRVRFDDGTAITTATPVLAGDHLSVAVGKQPPRSVELSRVVGLEQVNGPVSWLSSRTPYEDLYVPFFGNSAAWPSRMDRSVDGGEIRFKDQSFPRGIGVHAYSRLSWLLDGSFKAFRTRYAIDGDGALADVTVRILLDDKVVHERTHVRAGLLSPVIVQDLPGAKKLTLEVDFGSSGDTQDRLIWIEPALLRHKPAPETQPAVPATAPSTVPSTRPS